MVCEEVLLFIASYTIYPGCNWVEFPDKKICLDSTTRRKEKINATDVKMCLLSLLPYNKSLFDKLLV